MAIQTNSVQNFSTGFPAAALGYKDMKSASLLPLKWKLYFNSIM
jgi:hypothetical protein